MTPPCGVPAVRGTTLPSSICTGAFSQPFDVKQHPRAVRMMTDRLEQQLPIDTVEVTFDVDVEHPVVAPTALSSVAYGIDRRSAGPVAIRVGVEHRLQIRLQVASGDLLGDPVG